VQVTKLEFTPEELEVLNNGQFFAVKLSATRKIMSIFGQLEKELKDELKVRDFRQNEGINIDSGKIFRGENYLNLPYILLDFPRLFNTKSVFAYRNMFWWAHGFSFTLHLQGDAWERRRNSIQKRIHKLKGQDFLICVNESPWQYHFDATNYIDLDIFLEQGRVETLSTKGFIKLCTRFETARHEKVIAASKSTFRKLINLTEDQDPI